MKKLECLTSAPARLSVAMPLIFGLATIAATPTVEAVTTNEVAIIDGRVDINENGAIGGNDDLSGVALWCNDATPTKVAIIDGRFDVNEAGDISISDDLSNCDLNDENSGFPSRNQVDIIDGFVDVDESGGIDIDGTMDDAFDIVLFKLP